MKQSLLSLIALALFCGGTLPVYASFSARTMLESGALRKQVSLSLRLAVKQGNIQVVTRLIYEEKDNLDLDAQAGNGKTALGLAVLHGYFEIAELLLNQGVDLDIQDANGRTALHTAVNKGLGDMVQLLLDANADPDIRNNRGRTPLHHATYDVRETEIAGRLLEAGADPDIQDADGHTALYTVVSKGLGDMVQLLLDANADPDIRNNRGRTPLHHTAYVGDTEMARRLLEAGADPHIKDGFLGVFGKTALDYARDFGQVETEEFLKRYLEERVWSSL